MRKLLLNIISVFIVTFLNINVIAQNCGCITLDSSQTKLYLNGDNFRLIDNALRCFKLNSIAEEKDSLVRIWVLDTDFPDTPTTWRVQMFEFGKRWDVPSATLNVLEWCFEESDSSLPVKCIKQIKLPPNKGWISFEKDIRQLNLPELYKSPFLNKGYVNVDFGMLIIQFLFGGATYTVDFTGLIDVKTPINNLQLDHSKRMAYLFWYIEKNFSIKLSLDTKNRDFLKETMKQLNIKSK